MTKSNTLLVDYLENGSESAFQEIVASYRAFVHSTAARLVGGDLHRAEDVSQTVFADLAKMAAKLPKDILLGGWLHRHTCFVAANTMRGERRRASRERLATQTDSLVDHSDDNLASVVPILDEAINKLESDDRTAILLRFFEQHDLRSVGALMGNTENAAQKRVARALDQLRKLLATRGVALSSAALATLLAGQAVGAVPAGLASTVSTPAARRLGVARAIASRAIRKTFTATAILLAIGAGLYGSKQTLHSGPSEPVARLAPAGPSETARTLTLDSVFFAPRGSRRTTPDAALSSALTNNAVAIFKAALSSPPSYSRIIWSERDCNNNLQKRFLGAYDGQDYFHRDLTGAGDIDQPISATNGRQAMMYGKFGPTNWQIAGYNLTLSVAPDVRHPDPYWVFAENGKAFLGAIVTFGSQHLEPGTFVWTGNKFTVKPSALLRKLGHPNDLAGEIIVENGFVTEMRIKYVGDWLYEYPATDDVPFGLPSVIIQAGLNRACFSKIVIEKLTRMDANDPRKGLVFDPASKIEENVTLLSRWSNSVEVVSTTNNPLVDQLVEEEEPWLRRTTVLSRRWCLQIEATSHPDG